MSNSDDLLQLSGEAKIIALLNKRGDSSHASPEVVKCSLHAVKINRKQKQQSRIILVTDKAIYNIVPKTFKFKRRIALSLVSSVTASSTSTEFVIHIPSEWDYRYKTTKLGDQQTILRVLLDVVPSFQGITLSQEERLTGVANEKKTLINRMRNSKTPEDDSEDDDMDMELYGPVELKCFELAQRIGMGAFGTVYVATMSRTGKHYAMKMFKKQTLIQRNQVDAVMAERNLLVQLSHPFLVSLQYAFEDRARLYMVMDFYQGGDLFTHLQKRRRFTEMQAKFYASELVLGLGYLHRLGYIYRNLRPENILLDSYGHACLIDFDQALLQGEQEHVVQPSYSQDDTLEYLAPEIIQREPITRSVDWWALGVLLYELVMGFPPFYADTKEGMKQNILRGRLTFPPSLSRNCTSLISALLHRDPIQRLGSGDAQSGTGVNDIKSHPFFETVDWEAVFRKQVKPLVRPPIETKDPTSNFGQEFKAQGRRQSEAVPVANVDRFAGFEYQCPPPKVHRSSSARGGTNRSHNFSRGSRQVKSSRHVSSQNNNRL